jgi:glycine cleavage system regulatory protein
MTLAYETYNLSTLAAQHNYIDEDEALMIIENLNKKPFFKENPISLSDIEGQFEPGILQRGAQFSITITARYPIRMDMGFVKVERDWPVSFTVETTCLYFDKSIDSLYIDEDPI